VVRIPTTEGRRKELLRKGDTDTKGRGDTRRGKCGKERNRRAKASVWAGECVNRLGRGQSKLRIGRHEVVIWFYYTYY